MVLEPEWTSDLEWLYCVSSGMRPLMYHILFKASSAYAGYVNGVAMYSEWGSWFTVLAEISSRTSADAHPVIHRGDHYHHTLLTQLAFQFIETLSPIVAPRVWRRHAVIVLRAWIASLKRGGINLVQYGRRETELLLGEEVALGRHFFPSRYWYRDNRWITPDPAWKDVSVYLIGYRCGPEPEDWDF